MRILRESETPWADFIARLKVGIVVSLLIFAGSLLHVHYMKMRETAWWRTLTWQIPFTDVTVTDIAVTATQFVAYGTLVKARDCVTIGSPIAQVLEGGVAYPAQFSAEEPQGTPNNRPPAEEPQVWGPWVITSPVSWPDSVRLFRTHDCNGSMQTNIVFDEFWAER